MRIVRFIPDAESNRALPEWGLIIEKLVYPLRQAPYNSPRRRLEFVPEINGEPHFLEDVKLIAPVEPRKILCVGRNYAEHATELGNEVPSEPVIFLKSPSTLIGPNEAVIYPSISKRVDHEGELAVVIGKRCRYLNPQDADNIIFGYTIANDVTARDLQKKDVQWTRGKNFDTFGPVGPWIDTTFSPNERAIRCYVNGELRQEGNTSLMLYSIGHVLAYISQFITLEPGDLILTGTPSGVGPVKPGDVMTVEVEGLGKLENPVIAGV
jgi:2-keto-4-pentenoate hydratase/2-oxohepta-3-ene-1,7-dioic acid hydratase in catechol pathway